MIPTDMLFETLVARGFEMAVSGTRAALEARAERAESVARGALAELYRQAAKQSTLVDGTEVVGELAHLASVELPRAVDHAAQLMAENSDLRTRSAQAERDAELLTAALIGDEIRALQAGNESEAE